MRKSSTSMQVSLTLSVLEALIISVSSGIVDISFGAVFLQAELLIKIGGIFIVGWFELS